MRRLGQFFRLLYINYILARYGFDRVVFSTPKFVPFRYFSYLNPWNWREHNKTRSRAESIRLILEELGPIYVKFGQILSTRRDLLPDDIIDELEKLQDRVPPFPGEEAQKIVEQAYARPLNTVFESFELIPLASASIAQVHAANLLDGRKVVVKVRRPRIEKTIRQDIALLYSAAGFVERFMPHGRHLNPRGIVSEFERTIVDELDFMREASNASQLRRNFLNSTLMYVPEIMWDYTRMNVLVMERISGVSISDRPTLTALGINFKRLAEKGVEIFFTQVFRDNFFHADVHPGNIFVEKRDPLDPEYIAVDFGIMGSLSDSDQRYLAENLMAFFKRDYRRVALLHVESGWVPSDTRVEDFESAIRSVCEPIFEKPLREISFGQLLARLFQVAARFHMELQPQLLLLQKTLLNIEGLGRQLYPDLDLWQTGKPFLEGWIRRRFSIRGLLVNTWKNSPYWTAKLSDLPDNLYEALEQFLSKQRQEAYLIREKINQPNPKAIQKIAQRNFLRGMGFILIIVLISNLTLFASYGITPWLNWLVGSLGVLFLLISSVISA